MDKQREEYEARERAALRKGRCVDSGQRLLRRDDGRWYCLIACDCFGYTDDEIARLLARGQD